MLPSVGSEWGTPLTTREKEDPRHDHRNDDGSRHSLTPPLLPLPRLTHYRIQSVAAIRRKRDHVRHGATMHSFMLAVKLDQPRMGLLHEQVAAEIRRAIVDGEVGPGERLPPARDLAAVLGVNRNTVLRALRILRDEELLEFRRGRGITVVGSPERGALVARVKELVHFARQQGYGRDELVDLIETVP
jgi:GntR family transcriptional regulator